MIQLEAAHFSNLTGAVQRTASLTGGAVRGLPNEVVIDGLPGVQSFASSIADAQKEFQMGRARTALERIRQLETQFSAIVSRWNSTAQQIVSGAKQGRQAVSQAKLNEVRNAQTRMQSLVGPATKAFRDLLTALEYEITMEGRRPVGNGDDPSQDSSHESDGSDSLGPPKLPEPFSANYEIGSKLNLEKTADHKTRVVPPFQTQSFYLLGGDEQGRVIRVDELNKASLVVYDFTLADNTVIEGKALIEQLRRGIWAISRHL